MRKNLENHVALTAESSREVVSSTASHTPGPWTAQLHHPKRDGGRMFAMVTDGSIVPLAAVVLGVEGCSEDKGRANARLIAAAPDLLEAAIKTVSENLHLADGDNCTLAHLKRAIASATPHSLTRTG